MGLRTNRHKTAISRIAVSRPIRQALEDHLLSEDTSFLDYGCGRGGDVERLDRLGLDARGWDPVHRPNGERRASDVVNLGYVVNVIEDVNERAATLTRAWALAGRLLVVAARLKEERKRCARIEETRDGVVTSIGTFQKFFSQSEFTAWVSATLDTPCVAAAPGVAYVFKDPTLRERFLLRRYGRLRGMPRKRRSDERFEEHKDLLSPLMAFFTDHGRLPRAGELPEAKAIEQALGSLGRAFALVKLVTDKEEWEEIAAAKRDDLRVYLALGRIGGRPRFSDLPEETQLDVRSHFGTYTKACASADELLFSAGDKEAIGAACRASSVGKQTPTAVYVHAAGLGHLEPVLRVYEGCARSFLGVVEDTNVYKLHRVKSQVSYLSYPTFDKDPHPAAHDTVVANLDEFRVFYRNYSESDNPPILHRKEDLVPPDYPGRDKFARLTAQEERAGLFEDTDVIGFRRHWEEILEDRGVELRGHRLVRRKPSTD